MLTILLVQPSYHSLACQNKQAIVSVEQHLNPLVFPFNDAAGISHSLKTTTLSINPLFCSNIWFRFACGSGSILSSLYSFLPEKQLNVTIYMFVSLYFIFIPSGTWTFMLQLCQNILEFSGFSLHFNSSRGCHKRTHCRSICDHRQNLDLLKFHLDLWL